MKNNTALVAHVIKEYIQKSLVFKNVETYPYPPSCQMMLVDFIDGKKYAIEVSPIITTQEKNQPAKRWMD